MMNAFVTGVILRKSGRAAVGCHKRQPLSAFLVDAFDRLMRSVQNESAKKLTLRAALVLLRFAML